MPRLSRPAVPLRLALMAGLVVAGACDSGDEEASKSSAASTSSLPATSPTTATSQPSAVILRTDGFGSVRIDAPAAEAIAAATDLLGKPQSDDPNAGCESGAQRTVLWPAVLMVFHDGTLTGYNWHGEAPPAATDKGIKVGSTVAELKAAYPGVDVGETTIGFEWSVEERPDQLIGGYLSGSAPADKVEGIGVGDNCAFR